MGVNEHPLELRHPIKLEGGGCLICHCFSRDISQQGRHAVLHTAALTSVYLMQAMGQAGLLYLITSSSPSELLVRHQEILSLASTHQVLSTILLVELTYDFSPRADCWRTTRRSCLRRPHRARWCASLQGASGAAVARCTSPCTMSLNTATTWLWRPCPCAPNLCLQQSATGACPHGMPRISC